MSWYEKIDGPEGRVIKKDFRWDPIFFLCRTLSYFLLDLHVPLHAPISNRGACFLVRLVTKISVQSGVY